ncbi:hypothetical protein LSH36_10g08014 [Paralvinella palmiformis]|uniref:Uncharacterized protein n=1 Tax=Paralvinella palmiformis TaxID=53620 RepID=A0AAD9KDQ8_9ANNE|nr:hypothetical protein LSH36_10g08014 [Paralvinella palmiformis]
MISPCHLTSSKPYCMLVLTVCVMVVILLAPPYTHIHPSGISLVHRLPAQITDSQLRFCAWLDVFLHVHMLSLPAQMSNKGTDLSLFLSSLFLSSLCSLCMYQKLSGTCSLVCSQL